MNKWSLIIYAPAYNVGNSIDEFLNRIKIAKKELENEKIELENLIIVNDGSTDSTKEILKKFQKQNRFLQVVEFKKNKGAIKAVLTGMEKANKKIKRNKAKKTIIIRMDTDMEHDPLEIKKIIKPIIKRKNQVCAGYMNFNDYPVYWRLFNYAVGNYESEKLLGKKIPQFCPGFIAFRGENFKKIFPKLKKMAQEYKKKYSEDMLASDFASLVVAKKTGAKITAIALNAPEKKWVKKPGIKKLTYYYKCHEKIMEFFIR